jgi:hypothetical protein
MLFEKNICPIKKIIMKNAVSLKNENKNENTFHLELLPETLNYIPGENDHAKKHVSLFWDSINQYQITAKQQSERSEFILKDPISLVAYIKIPELYPIYVKHCSSIPIVPLEKEDLIQFISRVLFSSKFKSIYKKGFGFCYKVNFKVSHRRNVQLIGTYKAVL